jgi:GDP-L-fucose synthase
MKKADKIFIVGDKNIAGIALLQYLESNGFSNILNESDCGLDFIDQGSVYNFFKREKLKYVFQSYAKSGGIVANMKYPAEFICNN